MSDNKVVKSVSFNITNEKDLPLLECISGVKFAPYIKSLIEKDIRSRKIIKIENKDKQTGNSGNTTSNVVITKGTTLTLKTE